MQIQHGCVWSVCCTQELVNGGHFSLCALEYHLLTYVPMASNICVDVQLQGKPPVCTYVFDSVAVAKYAHVWLFLESPRYTFSSFPSHLASHRGPLVLGGAAFLGLTMKGP